MSFDYDANCPLLTVGRELSLSLHGSTRVLTRGECHDDALEVKRQRGRPASFATIKGNGQQLGSNSSEAMCGVSS